MTDLIRNEGGHAVVEAVSLAGVHAREGALVRKDVDNSGKPRVRELLLRLLALKNDVVAQTVELQWALRSDKTNAPNQVSRWHPFIR